MNIIKVENMSKPKVLSQMKESFTECNSGYWPNEKKKTTKKKKKKKKTTKKQNKKNKTNDPAHEIIVFITQANSEGSGEPAPRQSLRCSHT